MQNPFTLPAFNTVSLTAAINILPNNYGRIREMNLMPGKGILTRTVLIEEKAGVLTLLPTAPLGAPGTVGKSGKRKVRSFAIPHIPHDDVIHPSEMQGIRAFGSEDQTQGLSIVVNDKLQAMRNKHAITLEHLRVGALKGIILDADGTTLYNLYTEFGIEAKEVDFVLGTAGTNVLAKCMEVRRHIEANLQGEVMMGVRALVDQSFYDKLVSHANVKAAYANYQLASDRLGGDLRKGFTFGNITFEEYVGTASDPDGAARKFIANDEGHAFPEGTMDTFGTSYAPGDFIEAVNTIGLEVYAKMEPRKFGRGADIHTQSNPLPICRRPSVLVKIKTSN
jgi:hypothetical protein